MLLVAVRTLILYILVVVVLRILGKRQIGQLQPYELVVVIMISELAAVPSEDIAIPLISGIIPMLVLLLSGAILSLLSLKSETARSVLCGKPSVLIERGKILEDELKSVRYNLNDLIEQLRVKNVPNIGDVEFAILETNGELSIIPKSQKRPTIPEDFQIATKYEGLPITLIIDGKINMKNMQKAKVDINWLKNELQKSKFQNPEQVLLASLDSSGSLFIQGKEDKQTKHSTAASS